MASSSPCAWAASPAPAGRRSIGAPAGGDPAGVAVVGQRVEVAARRPAEHRHQRRLVERRHLGDGADAPGVELRRRRRPDAPQPLDGQRVQEVQLAAGRHDEQPVGLAHGAGHLGQELGASPPRR